MRGKSYFMRTVLPYKSASMKNMNLDFGGLNGYTKTSVIILQIKCDVTKIATCTMYIFNRVTLSMYHFAMFDKSRPADRMLINHMNHV